MTATFDRALDLVTRVRGVRGAMLVARDDGLVVAETSMENVRGSAVAALAASLAKRMARATDAADAGTVSFLHLQATDGTLLVVPAPASMILVVVADPDVNVGLARLEMLSAAETVQ